MRDEILVHLVRVRSLIIICKWNLFVICMEIEEAVEVSIKKWALDCAKRHKIAVPAKVMPQVIREFPQYAPHKKELMENVRDICTQVNSMKDKEIREEHEKSTFEGTTIYE